jgi:ATP-dependent DNA helicase RecQ
MDAQIDHAILQAVDRLGYASIRPHQREILEKLLAGQDCLFVAPTGSGKSLIFEAVPSAFSYMRAQNGCGDVNAIVVVISPLISLMKLQARDFKRRGITAAYLQVSNF